MGPRLLSTGVLTSEISPGKRRLPWSQRTRPGAGPSRSMAKPSSPLRLAPEAFIASSTPVVPA